VPEGREVYKSLNMLYLTNRRPELRLTFRALLSQICSLLVSMWNPGSKTWKAAGESAELGLMENTIPWRNFAEAAES
jgi:hypothetical protein